MHKTHLLICGILLLILVGGVIYQIQGNTSNTEPKLSTAVVTNDSKEKQESSFTEQKNEDGQVTVTVQPLFTINESLWDFEITFQTHSVELDMDILESVVLLDANGSEVKPLSWDGDGPKGHHRTGILEFAAPAALPTQVTVRVKSIAEIPIREFVWNL